MTFSGNAQLSWKHAVVVAMILIVSTSRGQETEKDSLVTIFPERRIVPEFIADGTGHRFSAAKMLEANQLLAHIGGTLPVVESPIIGERIQLSIGASVETRLQPQQTIAVVSTEFYLDYAIVDVLWLNGVFTRLTVGHTSHHLGDNALLNRTAFDYSRDYVRGFVGYGGGDWRVYAGANYGYQYIVEKTVHRRWLFEGGWEFTAFRFGEGLAVYGACDLKLRQKEGYGSTQRYQTGIQFRNGTDRLFRLALTHERGLEERGQFHGERVNLTSIGLVAEF